MTGQRSRFSYVTMTTSQTPKLSPPLYNLMRAQSKKLVGNRPANLLTYSTIKTENTPFRVRVYGKCQRRIGT